MNGSSLQLVHFSMANWMSQVYVRSYRDDIVLGFP